MRHARYLSPTWSLSARKVSRKGKDAYRDAINAAGVTGLTVLKCDSAQSTAKIFGGKIPAAVDPALANHRIKRTLIQKLRKADNPFGLGIEGVLHWQKKMQSLPHGKQYVWKVASENGEEIIITMLPYLPDRIHTAKASLHDNTYARVHGVWKEWEVVIWDHRVDFRVTIGRIYSQHEKLEIFLKMWPGLFETIAHVTKCEVKIKFIDGEGLQAIILDGNKPQANALGAYLVGRNRPHLSGIHERNPKLILPNCVRTCIFHVHRKFSEMAKVVPDEPMGRIRKSLYLKTQVEVDDFVQWCKISEYKVVRDWIADKDSIPWFFPSINQFLSNMSEKDCVKQKKRKGEKEKERLPDESELAGTLSDVERPDLSQPLTPVPALRAAGPAEFQSTQHFQLDSSLEPRSPASSRLFWPDSDSEFLLLPGKLTEYLPYDE
ncbi:hypothetical protein B0H17DRAFT_1144960 [Mycena rosella]|uniref:Transposase n=1 Tax=Mycena rosella TaxID=1033263 RepID=A0AAD7CRJ8_MYCRO|nr:hypothetical protein B0H17DRAFT_1144960 [Mycena rosella]